MSDRCRLHCSLRYRWHSVGSVRMGGGDTNGADGVELVTGMADGKTNGVGGL